MSAELSKHFNTKSTKQTEKVPGKDQVKNSESGFVFKVDNWNRLNRFLILGVEGGSYYSGERKLTIDNANVVLELLKEDGPRVVNTVVELSSDGRAYKNDYCLFVLAMATSTFANLETRRLAYANFNKVVRIGTHLFQFMEYRKGFAGSGRGLRRAVQNWYLEKTADNAAQQVVKYQSRNGWSHRDTIRIAHPKTSDEKMNSVLNFAVTKQTTGASPEIIKAMVRAHNADLSRKERIDLILEYKLTREMVPTEWLRETYIWEALLDNMPMTAMIRNLGNMSKNKLLVPFSEASKLVVSRLGNEELLKKARIHPMGVLGALLTYSSGKSVRGKGEWEVVPNVVNALDGAFYKTFKNVVPTGKNYLLGLDVSGSMGGSFTRRGNSPHSYYFGGDCGGIPGLSPRIGACAMALVTVATEENTLVKGFSNTFMDLKISKKDSLESACKKTDRLPFKGTDCSLPMEYAIENKLDVDVFVVYTDNETYAGRRHPFQALRAYRQQSGRDAKLVVVGMVSNGFTIADPSDPGMLDVVGFDTATPQVISAFSAE